MQSRQVPQSKPFLCFSNSGFHFIMHHFHGVQLPVSNCNLTGRKLFWGIKVKQTIIPVYIPLNTFQTWGAGVFIEQNIVITFCTYLHTGSYGCKVCFIAPSCRILAATKHYVICLSSFWLVWEWCRQLNLHLYTCIQSFPINTLFESHDHSSISAASLCSTISWLTGWLTSHCHCVGVA